jgi:hypothetical protein
MRYLTAIALAMGLFATGCATTQRADAVPSWLEMKDGFAQACIADGGCVPMSQRELAELVNVVAARALQMCPRTGI